MPGTRLGTHKYFLTKQVAKSRGKSEDVIEEPGDCWQVELRF